MRTKKSPTKSASSSKDAMASKKRLAVSSAKRTLKTAQKTSSPKTEQKKVVRTKASAAEIKVPGKKKRIAVPPVKTSGRTISSDKPKKTAEISEVRRPLKTAKKTGVIPSSRRPKAETAAAKTPSPAKKRTNTSLKRTEKTVRKPSPSQTAGKKTVSPKAPAAAAKASTALKTPKQKAPVQKTKELPGTKRSGLKEAEKVKGRTKKIAHPIAEEKKEIRKSPGKSAVAKGRAKTQVKTPAGKKKKASPEKIKKTVKTVKKATLTKKTGVSSEIPVVAKKEKKVATVTVKTVRRKGPEGAVPLRKMKEKQEAFPAVTGLTVKNKSSVAALKTPARSIGSAGEAAPLRPAVPQEVVAPKKATALRIFLPEEALPPEEPLTPPDLALPEEYGENELLLMEVDPSVVFVSWEIRPEDIAGETGRLILRVYDVTGIDFDRLPALSFFDIPVRNRVDSRFIDIKMPGRDVIMEIGLLGPDYALKAIKRSNRVSMPALQTFDELGITGPVSDENIPFGY